jgi:hypothetical protein
MAGRVLVRFWQAAQEAKSEEQILTLRVEVEYIMCARVTSRGWAKFLIIPSLVLLLANLGSVSPLPVSHILHLDNSEFQPWSQIDTT